VSAGIEARVAGLFAGDRGSRLGHGLLLAAMAVSFALLLWLNRGTSFWNDELTWLGNLSGPHDLEYVLFPHNSHLIGTTRLTYLTVAELVGADYVVFRILGALGVLLVGSLFFVWAKRRIGPGWALLPATLLLFYGSAWQHVVGPIGFTVSFSIAFGLAALIAIDRGDRRGDALACVLVILSVFTYTTGLAYLVGIAISVLLRRDRLRRAWVFLVPLALYAGWWIWSQQFDQGRTDVANLPDVVDFFARSMAANVGGITGLNIPWLRIFDPKAVTDGSPSVLAAVAAALVAGALVWRVVRGRLPRSFWVSLGVLVTYWLAAALAQLPEGTEASAIRYYLPGSTALLLVLVDAAHGYRIRGAAAYALVAVFVFSLAMNVVFLADGAKFLREQGDEGRIELAMLELRAGLEPGLDGSQAPPAPQAIPIRGAFPLGTVPSQYLAAVARYGSPALGLDDVRALPASERADADSALRAAGGAQILPLVDAQQPLDPFPCRTIGAGGPDEIQSGTYFVQPEGSSPSTITAQRFSDPPGVPLGPVPPGRWSILVVMPDRATEPWIATVSPEAPLRVCGVPVTG
jgi:hypothetical protein